MSDNYVILIPEDPRFVADVDDIDAARRHLKEFVPNAERIESKVNDQVQFFDCGGNFEEIICPLCKSMIPLDWWQARMDADYRGKGFSLANHTAPCCRGEVNLNQLDYKWPQGFAKFSIEIMNPGINSLSGEMRAVLEHLLGTKLRVVYQRI